MICWSIPVPIVANIPAILGKSKFHSIRAAIPRMITISEMVVNNNAVEDLMFLYLTTIITTTTNNTN